MQVRKEERAKLWQFWEITGAREAVRRASAGQGRCPSPRPAHGRERVWGSVWAAKLRERCHGCKRRQGCLVGAPWPVHSGVPARCLPHLEHVQCCLPDPHGVALPRPPPAKRRHLEAGLLISVGGPGQDQPRQQRLASRQQQHLRGARGVREGRQALRVVVSSSASGRWVDAVAAGAAESSTSCSPVWGGMVVAATVPAPPAAAAPTSSAAAPTCSGRSWKPCTPICAVMSCRQARGTETCNQQRSTHMLLTCPSTTIVVRGGMHPQQVTLADHRSSTGVAHSGVVRG